MGIACKMRAAAEAIPAEPKEPKKEKFKDPAEYDKTKKTYDADKKDYDEMMAKFSTGGVQLASDKERLRLLRAERARDIAALLDL